MTDEDLAFVSLFEAARECNCRPWELLKQPPIWTDWALVLRDARAKARKDAQKDGGAPPPDRD